MGHGDTTMYMKRLMRELSREGVYDRTYMGWQREVALTVLIYEGTN